MTPPFGTGPQPFPDPALQYRHTAMEPSALLDAALASARAASEIALRGWTQGARVDVQSKGAGDVVTVTDLAAETAAIAQIRARFPDHAILSEEAGADGTRSDFLWVIDPIDGSVNFAHGLPDFAVSVACLHRLQPLIGIIIEPARAISYTAVRGAGALRNGEQMRVSSCAELRQALLGTVFPKPGAATMAAYLPALHAALDTAQGVRRSGSMVLDLARLAGGQLDGFWQVGMKAWDLAAGSLLIEEAGGRIHLRNAAGTSSILEATSCVAAGPALFEALARISHR